MDIRIGIVNSPRELNFETDGTAAEVRARVEQAFTAGDAFVSFTDTKDKEFLVPVASIAYLELGTDTTRRVGFVG